MKEKSLIDAVGTSVQERIAGFAHRLELPAPEAIAAAVRELVTATAASRDCVGMAKGMLMARYDIDVEDAFALLQRMSRDSDTPLVELARKLVDSHRARGCRQLADLGHVDILRDAESSRPGWQPGCRSFHRDAEHVRRIREATRC